jgi:diaminopropionate ammonia-lyase
MNTRVAPNPHVDRSRVPPPALDDTTFHASLPGFAPTPIRSAPHAAARLGVRAVYVKDESQRAGMPSFKILGASWATYRTVLAHLGRTPSRTPSLDELRSAIVSSGLDLVLVAATDGNHGRAVARVAALLRLPAIILVPTGTVASRIEAIEGEGAQVRVVPGGYDDAIAASAALADSTHVVISDTSWEGYTDTPQWVIDGYGTMMHEVTDEIAAGRVPEPTVVAGQMGVGAFAAAVARHFAHRPARLLVGVEPVSADCVTTSIELGELTTISGTQDSIMAGLNCATPSPVAWDDLLYGYDVCVTVLDRHAEQAMRLLREDGIGAGESGAAGLAGLLAHARALGLGPKDDVLVFLTEGVTDPVNYARIMAATPTPTP